MHRNGKSLLLTNELGVQARVQQENQHGEQRQEAAAEHAVSQQPSGKSRPPERRRE